MALSVAAAAGLPAWASEGAPDGAALLTPKWGSIPLGDVPVPLAVPLANPGVII